MCYVVLCFCLIFIIDSSFKLYFIDFILFQPEEGEEQRVVRSIERGSPERHSVGRSEPLPQARKPVPSGGGSVRGGASVGGGGSVAGSRAGSRAGSTDDVGYLTIANFFKV
jgi:hypothetical protein